LRLQGAPTATFPTIEKNLAQFNPAPVFYDDMLPALWGMAVAYGFDPVVVIAQSGLETGFGKFGDVLDASYHNPCGLKSAAGGDDKDPEAHARFKNWFDGAEAQVQHLLAYMQLDIPRFSKTYDPRYKIVRGNPRYMPGITEVEGLDAWATKPNNGQRILNVALRLNNGNLQPLPPKRIYNYRRSLALD